MNWFLSLWPSYRRMAADLQEATVQVLRLQDRLDAEVAERQRVWALAEEALRAKDDALKMIANEHWQTRYGVCPYPEAPHVPQANVPPVQPGGPIPIGRAMPVQAAAKARREFKDEMFRRAGIKPEPEPTPVA